MSLVHSCEGAEPAAQRAAVYSRRGPQHVSERRGVLFAEAHKAAIQTGGSGPGVCADGSMTVNRLRAVLQRMCCLLSGRLGRHLQGVLCMCPSQLAAD